MVRLCKIVFKQLKRKRKMSANDIELKDLLIQTLELNGGLAKIRAQLRACIFKVFNEDENTSKQPQFVNNKLKPYLDDPDGRLMFFIVRNFLKYFDFDSTLSVFEQEACLNQCKNNNDGDDRQEILKKLSINHQNEDDKGPVLLELIKLIKQEHINISNDKTINESINKTFEINTPKILNKDELVVLKEIKDNGEQSNGNNQNGDSTLNSNKNQNGCDSNSCYEEDFTEEDIPNNSTDEKSAKETPNMITDENTSNNCVTITEISDKST